MYAVRNQRSITPNYNNLNEKKIVNTPFMVKSNDVDKHIASKIKYFENLKKQLDFHSTKASSIALRTEWLKKQKQTNYNNEYDRIRSVMEQNNVKEATVENLKRRRKEINDMAFAGKDISTKPFNRMSLEERTNIMREIGAESNDKLNERKLLLQKLGAKKMNFY